MVAMTLEMDALQRNQTWELVPLPLGEKTVGCKWVFTIKYQADGTIERYNARVLLRDLLKFRARIIVLRFPFLQNIPRFVLSSF